MFRDMGTGDRHQSSGWPRSARTNENNDQMNDMVLNREDQPKLTPQSVKYHGRQSSVVCVISELQLKCFKRRRAQEMTEANCTALKLFLKKFFRFAMDFIFFTDQKVFIVASALKEL